MFENWSRCIHISRANNPLERIREFGREFGCDRDYNRGDWPTMGILSKELKFKFLDRSFRSGVFVLILDSADLKENSVVVIGWVVVEGHETAGGGGGG